MDSNAACSVQSSEEGLLPRKLCDMLKSLTCRSRGCVLDHRRRCSCGQRQPICGLEGEHHVAR